MAAMKHWQDDVDYDLMPAAWPDHTGKLVSDPINPDHYKKGRTEAIHVIEDAVVYAPEPVAAGLQWNVLKYVLRCWHKGKALEDLKKAQWYLNRLVDRIEGHES